MALLTLTIGAPDSDFASRGFVSWEATFDIDAELMADSSVGALTGINMTSASLTLLFSGDLNTDWEGFTGEAIKFTVGDSSLALSGPAAGARTDSTNPYTLVDNSIRTFLYGPMADASAEEKAAITLQLRDSDDPPLEGSASFTGGSPTITVAGSVRALPLPGAVSFTAGTPQITVAAQERPLPYKGAVTFTADSPTITVAGTVPAAVIEEGAVSFTAGSPTITVAGSASLNNPIDLTTVSELFGGTGAHDLSELYRGDLIPDTGSYGHIPTSGEFDMALLSGILNMKLPAIVRVQSFRNQAFSTILPVATGNQGHGITYSLYGLPSGASFAPSSRTLSGNVSGAGSHTLTYRASAASEGRTYYVERTFTLTIGNASGPSIPVIRTLTARRGISYTSTALPAATGEAGETITYALSGLPTGLSFNRSTRVISGTPGRTGKFTLTYEATGNFGGTSSRTFTMQVQAPGISLATPQNITAQQAVAYTSGQLPAGSTSGGQTLTYSLTGLPDGLSFSSSTRRISGTTNESGVFTLTYTAHGSYGARASRNFTLTVNALIAGLASPGNLSATAAAAYTSAVFPAASSSVSQTWTYSVTGTLPSGMSFSASTRRLSGTPTQTGVFNLTYRAVGTVTTEGVTVAFRLTVNSATLSLASINNRTIPRGEAYNSGGLPAATGGGAQTITYSMTGLPAGLSFNSTNRRITGTPTTVQTRRVTYTARGSVSGSVSRSFTIDVYEPITQASPTFSTEEFAIFRRSNQALVGRRTTAPVRDGTRFTLPTVTAAGGGALTGSISNEDSFSVNFRVLPITSGSAIVIEATNSDSSLATGSHEFIVSVSEDNGQTVTLSFYIHVYSPFTQDLALFTRGTAANMTLPAMSGPDEPANLIYFTSSLHDDLSFRSSDRRLSYDGGSRGSGTQDMGSFMYSVALMDGSTVRYLTDIATLYARAAPTPSTPTPTVTWRVADPFATDWEDVRANKSGDCRPDQSGLTLAFSGLPSWASSSGGGSDPLIVSGTPTALASIGASANHTITQRASKTVTYTASIPQGRTIMSGSPGRRSQSRTGSVSRQLTLTVRRRALALRSIVTHDLASAAPNQIGRTITATYDIDSRVLYGDEPFIVSGTGSFSIGNVKPYTGSITHDSGTLTLSFTYNGLLPDEFTRGSSRYVTITDQNRDTVRMLFRFLYGGPGARRWAFWIEAR